MARDFGLTWWGQRWIEALERLGAQWQNRLPRGRTYARKGTVHGLELIDGEVTALVDGSRREPYMVQIHLPEFDDATWGMVVTALAGQVRHSAALLDGRMPEGVDDTLADVGVSLFPTAGEFETWCSCPDWANPCKHVAAVLYTCATSFDDDPFLLFLLRGRTRDEVLAALRAERSGSGEVVEQDARPIALPLDELRAADLFGEEPSGVDLDPDREVDPLAVLHRLGPLPAEVRGAQSAVEAAVAAASTRAWSLLTEDRTPA
jgi:uncharacterized Zn finger protein